MVADAAYLDTVRPVMEAPSSSSRRGGGGSVLFMPEPEAMMAADEAEAPSPPLDLEAAACEPATATSCSKAMALDDDVGSGGGKAGSHPPRAAAFFSKGCSQSLALVLITYTAALALAALLAHLQRHVGLVLLSLLPAAFLMGYMQRLFPRAVLRSEMLLTFFWTMVWMSPIVILENLSYLGVLTDSGLAREGAGGHTTPAIAWGWKLLSSFVRAYVLAAFFEELSKYMALRRLRRAAHVTDPRALAVYGMCAGAAFGTVEDLFIYAFSYGIDNTIARAFLSVPLHGMSGLLMGLSLAEDRFVHPGSRPWYKVLALPVLLHGTYDAVNFLLDGIVGEVALAVEILIVIGGFALARARLLRLIRLRPLEHNIHAAIALAGADKLALAEAGLDIDMDMDSSRRGLTADALGGGGGGDGYATDLDLSSSTLASAVSASSEGELAPAAASSGAGALAGPSRKQVALTGTAACVLTTGMLCFLYLWQS